MFDTIFGLPMHPLIVHATVVVVPLAAVVISLAALLPRFRNWAGYVPLGLGATAVVLVPLSTSTGEELQHRLGETKLIEKHADIAEGLLPWVVVLAVAALAIALMYFREESETHEALSTSIVAVVTVVALIGAVGTMIQVGRIGHSGATASWSKFVSASNP